jgi:multifunctional methyltransferase subunit TRM112
MRLLTHNTLRNNAAAAKGKGFPLKIVAAEIKVDESAVPMDDQRKAFLQGIIPTLDWPALVQVCRGVVCGCVRGCNPPKTLLVVMFFGVTLSDTTFLPFMIQAATEMGIPTLPPALTEDMANDQAFLEALNHILFHVHLVQGMLTCPVTSREFPVQNGIPNMLLQEEECETVRF